MTSTAETPDPAASAVNQDATASGHGRVYQAGRDLNIYETVLPEAVLRPVGEVVAPPNATNVPLGPGTFVGRDEELEALKAVFTTGSNVVIAAVHGLGGIGKSTLAARYATAQARQHNPVWWITADTPAAIEAGLAALATALQPELTQTVPLEVLAQRATAWLAAHHGWLLVLDNVTHPDHIAPLLARTKSGRVLVTSRLGEGWHRLHAQTLRLDVLAKDQAIDLLARMANSTAALDGAADLVTELGCLPLAVEQAGAYLHQTHISARTYLTQLGEQPAAVYDQAAQGGDAERTVARIWRLTLDQLTTVPLAGSLLRVLAWYGAEAIPRVLLNGIAPPLRSHMR
jgi:Mrp family chromosome partitioning ATPase